MVLSTVMPRYSRQGKSVHDEKHRHLGPEYFFTHYVYMSAGLGDCSAKRRFSQQVLGSAGLSGAPEEDRAECRAEGYAEVLQEGWDAPEGSRGLDRVASQTNTITGLRKMQRSSHKQFWGSRYWPVDPA